MWNISYYNLFLQFLYYRGRNKQLRETVVSMLSCGAFERSNNSYIESTVEPCVSKNQKVIFSMLIWFERKSWKRAEAMEESIPELKAEFVCIMYGGEKKNKFWNSCNHFKVYKKYKSPIQKGF